MGRLAMQLCFTVLLLLNLCLLLFGQLAMSFSVEYKVYSIVGEVAAERFEYSLFSGAAELYRRGLWPLATAIMLFSGAWPHLKLAVMLVVTWRPRLAQHAWAQRVHGPGKMSFFDVLVVALIIIIINVDVSYSIAGGAWLQATAGSGVFAFAGAIAAAQLLGAGLGLGAEGALLPTQGLRRRNVPPAQALALAQAQAQAQAQVRAAEGLGRGVRWDVASRTGGAAQQVTLVLALLACGACFLAFNFGAAATVHASMVTSVGSATLSAFDFSVFSGWALCAQHSAHGGGAANARLAAVGLLLVTVVPFVELAALAVLVLGRRRCAAHRRWRGMVRTLGHWSCLDVFLLAAFACRQQVPALAGSLDPHFDCEVALNWPTFVGLLGVVLFDSLRAWLLRAHLAALLEEERLGAVEGDLDGLGGDSVQLLVKGGGDDDDDGDDAGQGQGAAAAVVIGFV